MIQTIENTDLFTDTCYGNVTSTRGNTGAKSVQCHRLAQDLSDSFERGLPETFICSLIVKAFDILISDQQRKRQWARCGRKYDKLEFTSASEPLQPFQKRAGS
jgi:hypothetical protein